MKTSTPTIPRRLFLAALAAALTLPITASAQGGEELSADEIIDKMLDQNNSLGVKSGEASLTLLVEDRAGNRRVRKLDVKAKELKTVRTRVELTAPKEVKGQAFLFAQNKSGEDDVWMYLPAFGVTRRIEGSQKKGSFLGTHFTFADLESRDIEQATYKRLEDGKIGKAAVYVIESYPKKPEESDYGKVVSYVRKSDYMPLKFKFYGKDKKTELKTIFVEKIAQNDQDKPYIKQMTLRSKKGGFTTIAIDDVDAGAELPDAIFSKDQLGK